MPGEDGTDRLKRAARRVLRDAASVLNRLAPEEPDRAAAFVAQLSAVGVGEPVAPTDDANALHAYFDGVREGPGIWKWLHYFEAYDRHLRKFVGKELNLVEIGVYSGGSLGMWRSYFGAGCHVHGIDIEEACKVYEREGVAIHIGDQADREFWRGFRNGVSAIDVVIDDGGHQPEQQMVTLEELLPHMRAGGVYICEDIHGAGNRFASYVQKVADGLNVYVDDVASPHLASAPTPLQKIVHSVHLYPYLAVIELRDRPLDTIAAPRHGTEWQPFYDED